MESINDDDLVLVAVVPSRRDLEIARVLGWYRIPLESAPKTVRVDWLALYQTSAFPEDERWAVRYLARVLGHELLLRRELIHDEPDHPRADEPYYKLQLDKLLKLSRPIPAGDWKRFTFLYTTGKRLLHARRLKDLTIPPSTEHDRLWRMIRERSA